MVALNGRSLNFHLNRLANTLTLPNGTPSIAGTPSLDEQAAANKWAGTTGLAMCGALNKKAGTKDLGVRAVCNILGGTTDQDPAYALAQIP